MSSTPGHMMMSNHGINGTHSNGASPPKKPRLQSTRPAQALHGNHSQLYAMAMPRSPTYSTQPGLLDPAVLTTSHPSQQQHSHPPPQHQLHHANAQQGQQSHGQHQHPSHPPPHTFMMNNQTQAQVHTPNPSPMQTTDANTLARQQQQQQQPIHQTMPDTNVPNQNPTHRLPESQQQQQMQPSRPNSNHSNVNTNTKSLQAQNSNPNLTLTPNHATMTNPHTPVSMTADRGYQPSPSTSTGLAPEIQHAGLSDAQRRTQALLQLQQEQGMRDDELVEVMAEFETSIAAADTYLAIQKDQLRRMWLTNVVQRRRQPV